MPIILDIETIQDENQVFTEEIVANYLPKIDARLKDPEKIAKAQEELEIDINKVKGLDPDFGKIICIGMLKVNALPSKLSPNDMSSFWNESTKIEYYEYGRGFIDKCYISEGVILQNDNESELLMSLWDKLIEWKIPFKTITFNGLDFDIPFILKRSMLNRVGFPLHYLELRRFTLFPHFDLLQLLSLYGKQKLKSARFYNELYDLGFNLEKHDNIYQLWKEGKYEKIKKLCQGDCNFVLKLFNHIAHSFDLGEFLGYPKITETITETNIYDNIIPT